MPAGLVSCDVIEVALVKMAVTVERSKAVDRVYWFIASALVLTTNILVPSFENAMSFGEVSCSEISKGGVTKVALETSKGGDSAYWFIAFSILLTTNILVPSFENAMPFG